MAGIIVVGGQEAGSNADILQGTRLQSVPKNGTLTFELQASDNDATNNYVVSVELPSSATPLSNLPVPCGNTAGLAGVLDARTSYQKHFAVAQGGHCVFGCTETGDAELTWRVTFTPR